MLFQWVHILKTTVASLKVKDMPPLSIHSSISGEAQMRKTVVAPESSQSPPTCRCSPAEATCMKKGDEASLP